MEMMVQQPVEASNPAALAAPVPNGGARSYPSDDREPFESVADTTTPDLDLVDPRTMAVRQLLVGTMLVVVGVVVTAATYTTARNDGDRYLLAFGPIVIGAIAMVRGFLGLLRP